MCQKAFRQREKRSFEKRALLIKERQAITLEPNPKLMDQPVDGKGGTAKMKM
jgi:hypothetical protein